jgi:hypothetical protein
MSSPKRSYPKCHSDDVRARPNLGDWTHHSCGRSRKSQPGPPAEPSTSTKVPLFLSYGHRNAKELADRLSISTRWNDRKMS